MEKNIDEDADILRYRAYTTVTDIVANRLKQEIESEKLNLAKVEQKLIELGNADLF